jgi:DNA polymerase-3 subunit delta
MKIPPNRTAEFLRRPPPEIRGALLYGPDAGLVRERADLLTAAICGDLKDPFRISELSASILAADPARLADEVAAMSLVGGRRVVRIRDAGEALTALLAETFAGARGDSLIVIEAGDLPARSSLRKLCEATAHAGAIACYADSARDLGDVIRQTFAARRITVSAEAQTYLVAHLGGDRLVTRQELEKLALYVGDGGRVEFADAVSCIGDTTTLSVEELVYAAADGNPARLEGAFLRCLQEGQAPISILRAVMRHFQRLHLAASRMSDGASADEVARSMRPPIFFKFIDRFKAQLATWPPRRAAAALDALTRAELDSKRSVLPQETVAREALFTIVRAARR